jgi:signal transduction histidine kinase
VILRFRRADGEERQQIRWLAYVTAIGGLALLAAFTTAIGLTENETTLANEISFYVFFVAIGLGIPAAIGIALLRYRLWDLDIVLKKTLVATVVVVLIIAVTLVALLILSGILVGPVGDQPGLTLLAGLLIGVLFWPLLRLARRIADRVVYGGRATPYEVLTEFSERMADTYSTEDVLPRMASILGAGTGAEAVTIWLLVGRELRPAASWPADLPDEPRPAGELMDADPDAFEVRHQGDLLGAITVAMPANDPMNPSKERLVRDLTSQAGLVLRNVRLIEELRQSRRRIVAAVDEGRRRLERNIHDGAQQQLVALAVKLRLTAGVLDRDPGRARELLGQLQDETADALENLRDLARGIYPPLLADEGLAAALQAQARKSPVPVHVTPDGVGRYSQDVEASVYFCVLEALQNVAKYAGASRVDVDLRESQGGLAFEVRDDGAGFDLATAPRGTGLQGMADRVDAVGGTFEIRTAPGRGTTIAASIPVERSVGPEAPGRPGA